MSLILDALAKADAERRAKLDQPGTTVGPGQRPPRRALLRWVLMGVLAVALAAYGLPWLMQLPAPPLQAPRVAAPTEQLPPPQVPAPPPAEVPQVAPPAPRQVPVAVDTTPPADQHDMGAQRMSPLAHDLALLKLQQLPAETRQRLGDLKLNVHVFHARQEQRFVLINMRRLVEGQGFGNDLEVREIRPDGVVIRGADGDFLLPSVR